MDGLRRSNGGCGSRTRLFAVVAFWAGFVLAKNRGDTITRAQVSSGICFTLALEPLGSLPMMKGGGLLFLQKGILCVQRTGRNDRNRNSRGTALRNTNDCRLWGKCESRLGAHTSLGRTRKGGRVFVAIKGV